MILAALLLIAAVVLAEAIAKAKPDGYQLLFTGSTHFVSDLAGLSQGFRDTNAWLAVLTGNGLPAAFYAGDALGSFNSWMRLITGALFGISIGFWALPYLESLSRAAHPGAQTVSRP